MKKKIKKYLKSNIKVFIAFIIGIIVSGASVYGATILFSSDEVGYDNSTSGFKDSNGNDVTDVKTALDELYTKANYCKANIGCPIGYEKVLGVNGEFSCTNPKSPESYIKSLNTEGVSIATTDHENELRFIGSNPPNYVKFNNQTWRIIGIFDGKLKLIQNPIGNYSFDTSSSTVNRGYGVNQWGESTLSDGTDYDGADLMKLLNPGYEENEDLRCIAGSTFDSTNSIVNCGDNSASNYDTVTVNNSLYWNAGSGKCYTYGNYNTADCDFTDTGLSDTASKNMIDNATWYLGSLDAPSANIWDGRITASLLYNWERSNNSGKQCTQNNAHCSDTVNRTTRWTGKVGLLYPSDYAYATSGGSTYDRDECLSYTVGSVSSSSIPNWENTYTECKNNDWLLNTSMWTWTLSPRAISSYSYLVFIVNSTGFVYNYSALNAGSVRPVVYLKSSVSITSGDGTQSKPFTLTNK